MTRDTIATFVFNGIFFALGYYLHSRWSRDEDTPLNSLRLWWKEKQRRIVMEQVRTDRAVFGTGVFIETPWRIKRLDPTETYIIGSTNAWTTGEPLSRGLKPR